MIKKTTVPISSIAGFSLIELLLIITIVGFIALIILNLPTSFKLIGTSAHSSLAKEIASKQIEDLRLKSYDNLANGTINITDNRMSGLPQGSGTVVLEECPAQVCQNDELIKKATVTINWQEQTETKNVTIVTFISQGGLR